MHIFKILLLQVRVSAYLFCVPFKIEKARSQDRVALWSKETSNFRNWQGWYRIVQFYAICMPLRVIYIIISGNNQGNVASFLFLMVWTTISVGTLCAQKNIAERSEEIPLLINSIIYFSRKNRIKLKPGLTNIVTLFLVIGVTLSPVILPLLSWVVPCSPQYLGNTVLDCSDPSKLSMVSRIWIYFMELVLITVGAMSTGILSNSIVAIAGLLNSYILFVKNILPVSNRLRTLRERYIKRQAILYRQLQLLMKLYNTSFQMHHMPNIQCSCSAVIIGTLFGTIELHGKIPLSGYLSFPFFWINCTMILFGTIHLCSFATLSSISLRSKWRVSNYYGSVWLRVFARSCPTLKIRTGPFHVVDRMRLPIVYRFCLQRTFFFIVYSRK